MEQVLTLVCKLNPTPSQGEKLEVVLHTFAEACNYTNQIVKPDITSKLTIQGIVYEDLRAKFGLPANLAVRACARVGANRKIAKLHNKPVVKFKPTSADYDARIFAFREKDWTVSLTTLQGREHIKIDPGNYQRGKLKGRKPTSAQLCKHRDGQYYIHIQLKDEVPEPQPTKKVIGVDFGSKTIIQQAKQEQALVAIEDLTGIRERTNQKPRNKTERRRSNSWAFYQLRMFLEYKGLKDGVEVVAVRPAYTSQTCHRCLHIGLRSEKNFKCGNCKMSCDADLNGAKMIAALGLYVNQPGGSNGLYCSLSTDSSGLLKAYTVFGTPNQCG